MSFADQLNQQQQKAVTMTDGPVMIVAGPGTGKTKTLTARIVVLLREGVPPAGIAALTFTKKAAAEMRARVSAEWSGSLPHITTFHGLCYDLIGEEIAFITEPARLALIKELRKPAELTSLTARELALQISRAKNLPVGEEGPGQALNKLVSTYNSALKAQNLYDFDDLLRQAVGKLQQKTVKTSFSYLLIDEFQDTNALQYQLLQLLRKNDNICVIGDPLQSIYGFRGASGDIFERFAADFPTCQKITLITNYRSTPEVIALANAIFPEAPALEAHSAKHGRMRAVQILNEYSEASWVIEHIEQQLGGTDLLKSHGGGYTKAEGQFKDFAVLYRTHRTAKTIEQFLAESGIPYQVAGEGSPYERPTIKTIIEVLRFVTDGKEIEPPTGFSVAQWQELQKKLRHKKLLPPHQLINEIIGTLGIVTGQHVRQFSNNALRFESEGTAALLRHIDTIAEQAFYDPGADAITLLTIHAAKGLEFRYVFLIGAEEKILPHQRIEKDRDALAEERRLFYVAVTRAKERLDILYTKTRAAKPSRVTRFVAELPDAILEKMTDPAMTTQIRQREKRRQKRAQQSLF